MDFTLTDNNKCSGTISWTMDTEKFSKIVGDMNSIWEKQEKRAEDLSKEINSYLEKKCKEYCKKRDISFLDWAGFSKGKHECGKYEVYYKDELVCGAKVYSVLANSETKETNIKLELY